MLPSSKDIPAAGILDIGRDRVATILWTIRRGWKRARAGAGIEPGTPEVKLNVCLRDGMVEALKSQGGKRRTPRMQVRPARRRPRRSPRCRGVRRNRR